VTPEQLKEALEPTHRALADCANGVSQLLSSVEKLVLAIGVRDKGAPSIAMQLRDIQERLASVEASLIRVEAVAGGAREASDRTHGLLLGESNELGAKDRSMQQQIDELNRRLDALVAQKGLRRVRGTKP
jgi:hypothetical protein